MTKVRRVMRSSKYEEPEDRLAREMSEYGEDPSIEKVQPTAEAEDLAQSLAHLTKTYPLWLRVIAALEAIWDSLSGQREAPVLEFTARDKSNNSPIKVAVDMVHLNQKDKEAMLSLLSQPLA